MITPIILDEFKDRMHIDGDEDANITRILKASHDELQRVCGDYDINTHEPFKELVFERARYAYNDALEYFTKYFLTEINNLAYAKALDEYVEDDDHETVQVRP